MGAGEGWGYKSDPKSEGQSKWERVGSAGTEGGGRYCAAKPGVGGGNVSVYVRERNYKIRERERVYRNVEREGNGWGRMPEWSSAIGVVLILQVEGRHQFAPFSLCIFLKCHPVMPVDKTAL